MGRVVHFEIAADDTARARKFYEIFGWKVTDAGIPGMEYWLIKTGDGELGIDGAISPRVKNRQPVRNTIAVDNLDAMIEKVKTAGGNVVGETMKIPGIGDYVDAEDTEGNQFGMLQALPRDK